MAFELVYSVEEQLTNGYLATVEVGHDRENDATTLTIQIREGETKKNIVLAELDEVSHLSVRWDPSIRDISFVLCVLLKVLPSSGADVLDCVNRATKDNPDQGTFEAVKQCLKDKGISIMAEIAAATDECQSG